MPPTSTLYHSTILKTTIDNLGNTKIAINSGFKELFSGNLFKSKSIISDTDIKALEAYNAELKRIIGYHLEGGKVVPTYTSAQTAFNKTMRDASEEAQNMAASANGLAVNLEQIPKVSKASQLAIQGLSIAANVLAPVAISLVISKIHEAIQAQEKAREKAVELTNAYKEQQSSLDDQIKKYQELKQSLDEGNLSTDDARSIKEQLLEIQTSLIESYGDEASGLDLVNGKYKEQLGLLGEISKEAASDYRTNNRAGFETAQRELNKQRTYDLGNATS